MFCDKDLNKKINLFFIVSGVGLWTDFNKTPVFSRGYYDIMFV